MSHINTRLEEQTGGWFNIQIGMISELAFCPDYITNDNANTIVITENEDQVDILPVFENIKIKEPPRVTKSGTLYNIKADVEFTGQKSTIDKILLKYHLEKVFFIGVKHDGQQKLYGSKLFPLEFEYDFINGTKFEDGSLVAITVSGKIPQKPVFIND